MMRWKIACVNWGHDGAPKFISYVLVSGSSEAQLTAYSFTLAEAFARIAALDPRVREFVRGGGVLRG